MADLTKHSDGVEPDATKSLPLKCRSRTKKVYDSLFEAEVAVANMENKYGLPFEYYECVNHWHVANLEKQNQTKQRTHADPNYCKFCKYVVQWDQRYNHNSNKTHRKNVRKYHGMTFDAASKVTDLQPSDTKPSTGNSKAQS